jgi:O-antigen/teichoic acid export membrane protein
MGELIKLIVDLMVLKDTRDKGTFSWLVMFVGLAVTVVVFAVGLLVAGYYDRHPETGSGPIIGVLVFAVITLGATCFWGWRYQTRLAASRKPVSSVAEG